MDGVLEPSLEERQKYVEELQKFTQYVDEKVKELCSRMGFDFNEINKQREPCIICPFNSGHRVPERSIERHLQQCEWNTLGYTKDCKPLPESAIPAESPSTIKFDMELQHKVLREAKEKNPELNIGDEEKLIPLTSDRLMSDFTVDERKALYEYVIANTVAPDAGQDITNMDDKNEKKEEKSTTILELLQQERNLKRRRAKYRGVHTNKKTHTEILREVVEQQMEMYKEYISEKFGVSIPEDEKSSTKDDQSGYKADYHGDSENSEKHRQRDHSKDSHYRSNKGKYEPKDYRENSGRYKDDNYRNASKDRGYRHSQKYDDQREFSYWNRDNKHSRDKYDSNYKSKDRYDDSRSRKRSRSRSKEKRRDDKRKRSKSNERRNVEVSKDRSNKRSRSRSREKKRDEKRKRSESKERKKDENEGEISNERKNHKKHKKEHKKKRDRSHEKHNDRSHKHSKHEHKRRSRSWS